MLTVLSLAAQTSTEHYLESQPHRTQASSGFIDLFTVYYAAATHAISFPAVYLHRHNRLFL